MLDDAAILCDWLSRLMSFPKCLKKTSTNWKSFAPGNFYQVTNGTANSNIIYLQKKKALMTKAIL